MAQQKTHSKTEVTQTTKYGDTYVGIVPDEYLISIRPNGWVVVTIRGQRTLDIYPTIENFKQLSNIDISRLESFMMLDKQRQRNSVEIKMLNTKFSKYGKWSYNYIEELPISDGGYYYDDGEIHEAYNFVGV